MPKLKMMTIEEYVTVKAMFYPSLYASSSFKMAKLRVLNHLLNVVGNGIDFETLYKDSKKNKVFQNMLSRDVSYLFNGTPMYYVRDKMNENEILHFKMETGGLVSAFTMEEIIKRGLNDSEKYDLLSIRLDLNDEENWTPYPSFNKEYSILWGGNNLKLLPNSFLEGFIWFYKETLEFFKSDRQYNYCDEIPHPEDEEGWKDKIEEWLKSYEKCVRNVEGESEKMDYFSKRFGQYYNGDMKSWLKIRHKQKVSKAVIFINETIKMLEDVIEQKSHIY